MPEGPECRRIAESLAKEISGKKIVNVEILSGRYVKNEISGLAHFKESLPLGIAGAGVHGKFIYWICENEYSIWNTLGMSGSWKNQQTTHSRVRFDFSDSSSIFFEDMRNFGTLKFVVGKHQLIQKLQSLGPDMLNDNVTPQEFIKCLRKKNSSNICKVLMNQAVIAGVGNYLKADSLWAACINPFALVEDLNDDDLTLLCKKISSIIRASYESGGATIQTYSDVAGQKGSYSSRFLVYNRKVDPMGHDVIKEHTPDGRKTHWVKEIQTKGNKDEIK